MKSFLIAVIMCCTPAAYAQKTNIIADTLMYLHNIANNNFDELHPLHNAIWETLPQQILGADKAELYDNGMVGGYQLWLTYYKNNSNAHDVLKQVKKWLERMDGTGDYRFQHITSKDPTQLVLKNVRILGYGENTGGGAEMFHITVFQTIPSLPALASEAAYHGKYPSAHIPGTAPQIVQLTGRGNGPDSYMRFNGIFGKQGLLSGKISIHGYGAFYEGDWYSKNFHPEDKGRINTMFVPANTNDTIYGALIDSSMNDFDVDVRYSGYVKNKYYNILPDAPDWVTLNKAHSLAVFKKYQEDRDAEAAQKHNGGVYINPDPGYKGQKPFLNVCSCCHGSRVQQQKSNNTYSVTDKYGNNQGTTTYINVTCPCCHGTGTQ